MAALTVGPHVSGRLAKGDVLLHKELGLESGGGGARAGGRSRATGPAPPGARGARRSEMAPQLGEARLGVKPGALCLQQGQLREQGLLDAHGGHVEGDTGPARSAPRQEEGSEVADSLAPLPPKAAGRGSA